MRQLILILSLTAILFRGYPAHLTNKDLSDNKNLFHYTEHFRIITGEDSKYISTIVSELKSFSEYVWLNEITNFKEPINSDINYIDVYIANSKAVSPEIGEVNVEPYIAGYSGIYPDNTPYIVMNPYITSSNFKSTFAHELFHTIQFSYFNIRQKSNEWWQKNLWWIESTAKYVEYLIFPKLHSYISSANIWIDNPCKDIDKIDFKSEYSKVLLAIYLDDVSLIDRSFRQTENYNSYLEFLESEVGMDKLLLNVSECIICP